jgi:4-hydroxy 2-oxovalerate aldolase
VISLLDTTLRDGGHLIDGKFSEAEFRSVVASLARGGLEYIEIGWLGPHFSSGFSTFTDSLTPLIEELRAVDVRESKLLFMVRPDKTRTRDLTFTPNPELFRVRLAFHYQDIEQLKSEILAWKDLGVEVWLNPIDMPGYTQHQIGEVVTIANLNSVRCLSIVDTYGIMTVGNLEMITNQLEGNLDHGIALGLHSHDNIQLSLALAMKMVEAANPDREYVIDASLLGMGRDPGNLKLELIAPMLNSITGSRYDLDAILSVLSDVIAPIYDRRPWGYDVLYAFSSIMRIDRSYAEHLLSVRDLNLNQKVQVIRSISAMGSECRAFSPVHLEAALEIERARS